MTSAQYEYDSGRKPSQHKPGQKPRHKPKHKHIVLTSHPRQSGQKPLPIRWGHANPDERGPIIATLGNTAHRNAIGTHSGAYAVYRALAVASGTLESGHRADLTNTSPTVSIGPHPSWADPEKIVSIDPFGALDDGLFSELRTAGYDIRPSIAITKAHINIPEMAEAVAQGRVSVDGKILNAQGELVATKAAIEPVWYLPGIAKRFGVAESDLRRTLFEQTGGMFPELVTRPDLQVFLPPIGGYTVYILGDVAAIADPARPVAVRMHDECNGSDVFGSDICTCRPYLVHGIEVALETAQAGGAGIIIYARKEGRALGEVTKFLVYNARKRQEGGDRADTYFTRTECVAGVQDMRFQELMPDVMHWLGISRIDRFVSMSNLKYNAIVHSGIEVGERITIPEDLIPADAQVEMNAKKAAGYYTDDEIPDKTTLTQTVGRQYEGI
ncbi:MAG: GTP cyclohydrolase II [Cyanobacteria bacterium J06623_5]